MTVQAILLVPWLEVTTPGQRPQNIPDLAGLPLLSAADVTRTAPESIPPRTNAVVLAAELADAAALAAVAADPRVLVLRSWTVTTDRDGDATVSADTAATKLTAGQRTAAATWLAARGFKAGDLSDVDFSGLSRAGLVETLRVKLARATKG